MDLKNIYWPYIKKVKKIRVSNIQRTHRTARNMQTNNNKTILNELVDRYENPGVKPLSGRIKKSTEEAITFELGLSQIKEGSVLNKWRSGEKPITGRRNRNCKSNI